MTATDQPTAAVGDVSDTKRALIELRLRRRRAEAAKRNAIERIPREGYLPVARQQRYQWLLDQLNPGSAVYNVPFALRLRGTLDRPALQEALRALVARHESLRTTFHAEHGTPYQVIAPPPADWPARTGCRPGWTARCSEGSTWRTARCCGPAWPGWRMTSTCWCWCCTTSSPTAGRSA